MGRAKRAGEREESFGRGQGRKDGCVEEGRRVWEGDNEGSEIEWRASRGMSPCDPVTSRVDHVFGFDCFFPTLVGPSPVVA
jgi:hypothetical protein